MVGRERRQPPLTPVPRMRMRHADLRAEVAMPPCGGHSSCARRGVRGVRCRGRTESAQLLGSAAAGCVVPCERGESFSLGERGVPGADVVGVGGPSRPGVVGGLGEGARSGERVSSDDDEREGVVSSEGVRPRGEGSAHEGGGALVDDERAGDEVTDERLDVV